MQLRDLLLRTLVKPVWVAGEAKIETWTCPACGRDVERTSPAWKGIWFTATPDEVTGLCSRVHRTHTRKGGPLAPTDAEAHPGPGDEWVPVVAVERPTDAEGPPAAFVALVPPHGVAFVLDADAGSYELRRLRGLAPSDLVGAHAAAALDGERLGAVPVDAVELDGDTAVRFSPPLPV